MATERAAALERMRKLCNFRTATGTGPLAAAQPIGANASAGMAASRLRRPREKPPDPRERIILFISVSNCFRRKLARTESKLRDSLIHRPRQCNAAPARESK